MDQDKVTTSEDMIERIRRVIGLIGLSRGTKVEEIKIREIRGYDEGATEGLGTDENQKDSDACV